MTSRRQQKERLRQERLERERAAAATAARRRRLQIGGGAIVLIAAIAVGVVLAVTSGGGGSKSSGAGTPAGGALPGLQTTRAPWQPEYGSLSDRIEALKLPALNEQIFHIHALLRVFVDGKRVPVPANIGIDPQGRFGAPLHTHDATGVIHIESERPYPFTLGQLFTIWGVWFTDRQIGAYKDQDGNTVQVYVNGKRVNDAVNYVMKPHDLIVVGYGRPGSFPTKVRFVFPAGE